MIRSLIKALTLVMLFTATVAADKTNGTAKQLRDLKLTDVSGLRCCRFHGQ